jgi:hypothetical protein
MAGSRRTEGTNVRLTFGTQSPGLLFDGTSSRDLSEARLYVEIELQAASWEQ